MRLQAHAPIRLPATAYLLFCLISLGILEISVARAGASTDGSKPNLFVLAIGVSEYDDPSVPRLTSAHRDAENLVAWAKKQEGSYYGHVRVDLLVNGAANYDAIHKALKEVPKRVGGNDTLIVFLAGHGGVFLEEREYYFLPTDVKLDNLSSRGISQSYILQQITPVDSSRVGMEGRVLLLVDTCRAGMLAKPFAKLSPDTRGVDTVRSTTLAKIDTSALEKQKNMVAIMTAGSSDNFARESSITSEGGIFTLAVLEALSGSAPDLNHDGNRSMHEVSKYVSERVRKQSDGQQVPQIDGVNLDQPLVYEKDGCDGRDIDGDGLIDEDCIEPEKCDGLDNNRDGVIDNSPTFDKDGDGHLSIVQCRQFGDDCNDSVASIYPGVRDIGNLIDDDCDDLADEDDVDKNGNMIPDFMESVAGKKRIRNTAIFGSAVVIGMGAGLSYYGYSKDLPSEGNSGNPSAYQHPIDDAWLHRTARLATASRALPIVGILTAGVGFGFQINLLQFKSQYFPEVR